MIKSIRKTYNILLVIFNKIVNLELSRNTPVNYSKVEQNCLSDMYTALSSSILIYWELIFFRSFKHSSSFFTLYNSYHSLINFYEIYGDKNLVNSSDSILTASKISVWMSHFGIKDIKNINYVYDLCYRVSTNKSKI